MLGEPRPVEVGEGQGIGHGGGEGWMTRLAYAQPEQLVGRTTRRQRTERWLK